MPWDFLRGWDNVEAFDGLAVYDLGALFRMPWNWQIIKIDLSKDFKFVRENSSFINTASFEVQTGEIITAYHEPVEGTWTWSGATRRLGQSFTIESTSERGSIQSGGPYGYFTNEVFTPTESDDIEIVSQNPNIISCTNSKCTALKEGAATVKIKFLNSPKQAYGPTLDYGLYYQGAGYENFRRSIDIESIGNPFYGSDSGYGRLKVTSAYNGFGRVNKMYANQKTIAYRFPDTEGVYTITVLPEPNQPQIGFCSGVLSVTHNSALVSWSYADPDNDPQTNYRIQIATDSNFNTVVKNITKPNGTDVKNLRTLNVTGLNPNTRYYAQIRTYNDKNGWSDFSKCSGSFTTLNQPINAKCGTVVNTCNPGTFVNKTDTSTQYLWSCNGSNGGTNAQCPLDKAQCSITFNKNAASATGTTGPQSFYSGQTKNLLSNGFNRPGYAFMGWNTNSAGTGTDYGKQAPYTMSDPCVNKTLFAQWESQDLCSNIAGNQTTVPAGTTRQANGTCTCNNGASNPPACTPVVVDMCTNIAGNQATVPVGTTRQANGTCTCNNGAGDPPLCTPLANRPPLAPTIDGATTGTPNTEYTFTIRTTDPDGDVVGYGVDWDKNNTVDEWYPLTGSRRVPSGISSIARRTWSTTGAKTFQARAIDKSLNNPNALLSGWTQYTIVITEEPTEVVNGQCDTTTVDSCDTGDWVDRTDTSSEYRWTCNGRNGGTNAQCSFSDMCTNISGLQEEPPSNTYQSGTQCLCNNGANNPPTCTVCPPGESFVNGVCSPPDMCSNIAGPQATAPSGTTRQANGTCTCNNGATNPPSCVVVIADPTANFWFNPNVVNQGDSCGFYLTTTNATACTLSDRNTSSVFNGISSSNSPISVGRYTLACLGTNGTTKAMGSISCYSNADVREN
jgi:hypothetical protein